MRKDATAVLSYTPREFTIMIRAQAGRNEDEYERMAHAAMMNRQAYHAKKLKFSDLFKRPSDKVADKTKLKTLKEKTREANEWLAGLTSERRKE
ncbi:hypothetical protein MHZ92_14295 [Sporosarcina sp. ACRSL]|uniref:hypothetical protein n=1 Tax=Sporosarcina sp. ACRSL TaxID=2918215 RepID=UPI001EF5DB28|nr:hypothetical protein [Sporosarcina sp. ACRSL]MCG7345306.1 hypothetical protein [Sporosarcina sp. ACRSL]